MKCIFIILSINFIVVSFAYCQHKSVYVSNGVLFPSVYSNSFYGFNEYIDSTNQIATYFAEMGLKYYFKRNIGFSTGLTIEKRGWSEKIFVVNTLNGELHKDVEAIFSYTFITLPILMEASVGKKVKLFGNGGINISFRTAGGVEKLNYNEIALSHYYPEELTPKLDISWTVRSGIYVALSQDIAGFVEASYYKGLTRIGTRAPIEAEIKHKGKRIAIGGLYTFKD